MTLKLRPYQEECLNAINDAFREGITRQLVHLPTAAGKTVIFAHLIQERRCRTLVLAHTLELLEQAKDKIKMLCPDLDVGLVNADKKEFNKVVVISTIQSARQPENLKQLQAEGIELVIYDEAHRCANDSSRCVLDALGFGKGTKRLLVGFSATPFRNDSKGLGEIFEKTVYHKSIKDLISIGYLCKPVGVKIKSDLDLSAVATQEGDFISASLASVMDTPAMIEIVADAFIERAHNRKAVAFAVTVAHAQNLAEAFRNRGIASAAVYGDTSTKERNDLLESFRRGNISVLTNCQLLTEGWDCPEVDCVLIAKPTKSKGLYIQMAGRGLRLYPNKKDCLILDFGSQSHSLCSTADLVGDAESEAGEKEERAEGKLSEFAKCLPPSINKKLKASILEFDPLGDDFFWQKDGSAGYTLKGCGCKVLKIFTTAEGKFSVMFFDGNDQRLIARDFSFEYAFAAAEGFAKDNHSHFIVSDFNATWRTLPISDKQRQFFRSHGYRAGIDDLSRGQAALIISSGVLNRKVARR